MSKFSPTLIIGAILVLFITGSLIFSKNQWLEKTSSILVSVRDAFQNLFGYNYVPARQEVATPIVKKEDLEEETIEKEEIEENSDFEQPSPLDKIVEKIDEISEKVDLLTQEVESFIEERNKVENVEKVEEIEEEEETIEEIEEFEEEEEELEERNVPEKEIILCQKGNQTPTQDKVIFNEISWMGTTTDWRNEWMELKNLSGSDISLVGWQILDEEQEVKIIFEEGEILANQFFLFERTSDDSMPNILADKIYSGNLNDVEEGLYLFDENCQLQDEIIASPDWPAGNKEERKSMERDSDFNWYTFSGSADIGILGTPRAENSPKFTPTGGGVPPPASEPTTLLPKILISEVKISEKKGDKNIFVELYNLNNYEIDLTNWYLQRKTEEGLEFSSFASKTLFSGKKIPANSYLFLARQGSDFESLADLIFEGTLTENNVLALKNPNQEIVDKVGWGQAQDFETAPAQNPPSGESLGRKWLEEIEEYQDTDNNQEDFEIQDPTPKEKNQNSSTLLPPVVEDDIAPQVNFESISSLQTETQFLLFWIGQDFAPENATPSGIDTFYLQFDLTPSDIDGIAIQYQDINNSWQEWKIGQVLEFEENQNSVNLLGEDGKIYIFRIKAKDKLGNESREVELIIEINTHPIVINEVYYDVGAKMAGESKEEEGENEWIEVYNLTNSTIDISNWIIEDNGGVSRQKTIPTQTQIPAQGFAVITPSESTWLYWTIPDKIIKITLGEKIGSHGLNNDGDRIILREPTGKEIDAMSYGDDITIFELLIAAKEGESLARQTVGYDTDTASDWQVLNMPTPGQ